MATPIFYQRFLLFSTENSVTGITEARTDISVIVKFTIECANIKLNVRVRFHKGFNALRRCYDRHKFNFLTAVLFNVIYCCDCRTACCKHRVYNNDLTLVYRLGKFAVIFVRLMSDRVTIKSDVTYSC